jgi:tetratricopeptide (TPR) repeat protein
MTNGIPLLGSRSPLVEEFCGKHRIDFCTSSPASIAEALQKAACATALKNNITKKNLATVESSYSKAVAGKSFQAFLDQITGSVEVSDQLSVEDQIVQVENFVANKQYLNAIELIESIFENESTSVHQSANLYRLIGDCFAKLGDNESAKDAYTKALSQDEYSAKSYIGLGTVSLVREAYDSAVFNFQKAIGLAPKDEMANLGLGLAFQGLKEFKEAMKWVVKSLDLTPDNKSALYTAVQIGHDLGDYSDTARVLEQYLVDHPSDHNFAYTLAGIYFSQGDKAKAMGVTDKILKDDPQHELAIELRSQIETANVAEGGKKS